MNLVPLNFASAYQDSRIKPHSWQPMVFVIWPFCRGQTCTACISLSTCQILWNLSCDSMSCLFLTNNIALNLDEPIKIYVQSKSMYNFDNSSWFDISITCTAVLRIVCQICWILTCDKYNGHIIMHSLTF